VTLVSPAIRKVVRLGHPVLREPARELSPSEVRDPAVQRLIEEMIETMAEYEGVGVAAPQVGEGLSLFVMGLEKDHARHPAGIELTVVANPRLRFLGEEKAVEWEGCLSLPGLRGQVPRWLRLELSGLDGEGQPFSRVYEGFPARVVQHETDHLNCRLYIDRMPDLLTLGYVEEHARRRE
jgi:peptide deformylase